MASAPNFNQLNLIVNDVDATVAFYRLLGLAIDAPAGASHVEFRLPNGTLLEIDAAQFAQTWDTGWPGTTGSGIVIGFAVESRERVDALYADLTEAGYRGRQPPYDAFWGARYAIVQDPDGNGAGLMSPIDPAQKFWPPSDSPRA